jgi:hypothetical protein
MSLLAEPASSPSSALPLDDLGEGNLILEVQVPSWPPPVTQTLLRSRDSRYELLVRAKPSGRLRVELLRSGYPPLVVRTVHLQLQAPALLRLRLAWRGEEAVVAAGGQVIGTSRDFIPEGLVTPVTVEEIEGSFDRIGNERARAIRRGRAEALLQRLGGDVTETQLWFGALATAAQTTIDLVDLVRQGRRHHLAGVADQVVHMIAGDGALLQCCAALLDAPLLVHAPPAPPREGSPAALLTSAFDVVPARGSHHEFAVDLDVWLCHEHPWLGGRTVPVEALLLAADAALSPPSPNHNASDDDRPICMAFAESQTVAALCTFAATVCSLAVQVAQAGPLSRVQFREPAGEA